MHGRLFADRANHVRNVRDGHGDLAAGLALVIGPAMDMATGFECTFGAFEHGFAGTPLFTDGLTDLLDLGRCGLGRFCDALRTT